MSTCKEVIPDTFIACGEGGNYCSDTCLETKAMKPWEDNWEHDGSGDLRRVNEDRLLTDVIAPFGHDFDACELAAAAPDMARVLLAVEWEGMVCVDIEWYAPCCPSCGGVDPTQWSKDSQARIKREGFILGHKSDCALDAALRKAGVR